METIMISTILVNICIGCFACVGLTTAISMIQSIINDHKREKREQEKDKRDLEYHEKRMKSNFCLCYRNDFFFYPCLCFCSSILKQLSSCISNYRDKNFINK